MTSNAKFRARIGAVNMPEAVEVIGDTDASPAFKDPASRKDPRANLGTISPDDLPGPLRPIAGGGSLQDPGWWYWKYCNPTLKQGCYTLSYRPKGTPWWGNSFLGTLRIERVGAGYRISGDIYRRKPQITAPWKQREFDPVGELPIATEAAHPGGVIPVYPRKQYVSYLKGTGANTYSIVPQGSPCNITLDFDEFDYTHPASGFSGSFPAAPTRALRYALQTTSTPNTYSGKVYEGATELGTVTIKWVSQYFRRAKLEMRRLSGAEHPPEVGSENFRTIFATAGWDLSVTKIASAMSKPASLAGQSATDCWSTANLHRLMETVPGYDPSVLDKEWKAYLLAVPAELGCSRGVMFDNSGDLNNIKREGAGTFSHDGFPDSDTSTYGAAENDLMKDHPRAFLRSAAHEVGHTFNQIHQFYESGSDNSIMTVTPSVADFLSNNGQTFPDDINLGFNGTVRRHLIHLPDPAVRPGAMVFFGFAINAPEADQVGTVEELEVVVKPGSEVVSLGEPLPLSWSVTNTSDEPIPVPERVDMQSLAARISVTNARGDTTFIRPVDIEVCSHNKVVELAPGATVSNEVTLFYGSDGFAITEPGRHTIEVAILWQAAGAHLLACGTTSVWAAFPSSDEDNKIASLLLDPQVGVAVALGNPKAAKGAEERIVAASRVQRNHPACAQLRKKGLLPKSRPRPSRKKKA